MNGADLILHPVRMRIITVLSSAPMTAAGIGERLRDVPPATLYRHLGILRRGGVIVVSDERRVRGATERRYTLPDGAAVISPDALARMPPDEHLRLVAGFVASLLGAFARYLARGAPNWVRDGVGVRQVVLNLSEAEFAAFGAALNAAVIPYLANQPAEGRIPRLLATVMLPTEPPPSPPLPTDPSKGDPT
jgi:DNA-binding transcriptional ArsR family regulator